jgi:hypothetical protein
MSAVKPELNVQDHVALLNRHAIDLDPDVVRLEQRPACDEVELPSVPRAAYYPVLHSIHTVVRLGWEEGATNCALA